MGRDDKHDASDLDEDDDGESHAADEPTAVWDENALRAAGLGDLWRKREADPSSPPRRPSTVPTAPAAPSIVVEESLEARPAPVMAKVVPQPQKSGLGWGATLAIAVVLGAVAYALIRIFKG